MIILLLGPDRALENYIYIRELWQIKGPISHKSKLKLRGYWEAKKRRFKMMEFRQGERGKINGNREI
jgi:hypothetical protein